MSLARCVKRVKRGFSGCYSYSHLIMERQSYRSLGNEAKRISWLSAFSIIIVQRQLARYGWRKIEIGRPMSWIIDQLCRENEDFKEVLFYEFITIIIWWVALGKALLSLFCFSWFDELQFSKLEETKERRKKKNYYST